MAGWSSPRTGADQGEQAHDNEVHRRGVQRIGADVWSSLIRIPTSGRSMITNMMQSGPKKQTLSNVRDLGSRALCATFPLERIKSRHRPRR
jgi:hypothetical protein